MKSHWIKRIVRLLVLLFGVSILCFILTALSSTDPATYLVRRGNLSPTPEVIEQVTRFCREASSCSLWRWAEAMLLAYIRAVCPLAAKT